MADDMRIALEVIAHKLAGMHEGVRALAHALMEAEVRPTSAPPRTSALPSGPAIAKATSSAHGGPGSARLTCASPACGTGPPPRWWSHGAARRRR